MSGGLRAPVRRDAPAAMTLDERREAQRSGGAFGEVLMDGFQIKTKQSRPGGFSDATGVQIEKQLKFPWAEGVAHNGAPDDFLDQLVEGQQVTRRHK